MVWSPFLWIRQTLELGSKDETLHKVPEADLVVVVGLYDRHWAADFLRQPGILRGHSDDDRKLFLLCFGPLQRGRRFHRSVG